MNSKNFLSVSSRRSLFIWGLFCAVSGTIFVVYALASRAAGRGDYMMPLDDVYIHFQYARQIAAGQPYIYNPGLPPSSGATSFLYPYILAAGYLIGFQGLNLGLWAMAVGALALVGSMWLVYKLAVLYAPEWLAVAVALIFAVSGAVSWHFMSGMETGLVVLFSFGTVYALTRYPHPLTPSLCNGEGETKPLRTVIVWATLMALIRPEGAVLAALAMGVVFIAGGSKPPANYNTGKPTKGAVKLSLSGVRRRLKSFPRVLLVPLLAIGVQPIVNLVLTGSAVASGNSAKSVFGMIPFSWGGVIGRIASNFVQMWTEFLTGSSPREGVYILPLMLILALVGIGFLLAWRERRGAGLVIVGWLLGGTLLIATLDTAFWHFKRYQMPFMALLFPLAGWGIEVLSSQFLVLGSKAKFNWLNAYKMRNISAVLVGLMSLAAVGTAGQFFRYYAVNVDYVYLQPLQMARWLEANTPPDAVIAVHDTGMMRYMGGRTTLDMVGLTTPGAADYWRNGPGSVAEYLMDKRPDYIAAYGPGHGFGLGMIADTSVYGKLLASFPVQLDNRANVALAADFQGIYKPDWGRTRLTDKPTNELSFTSDYLTYLRETTGAIDEVNVADLVSEREHSYIWQNVESSSGFPTEVHEMEYRYCINFGDDCSIVDSGRLINNEESFSLKTQPGKDAILVTRLHPAYSGTFDVYSNGAFVATRWIPAIPGKWLDVATLIPARRISSGEDTEIRIVPHVQNGFYMPYYHWLLQGSYVPDNLDEQPMANFQRGAFSVYISCVVHIWCSSLEGLRLTPELMQMKFEWYTDGSAQGDYKLFVHVYKDINQPPVAQWDGYPGDGTLPPGDWLPGVLRDTITVDLKGVPAGKYKVAIGLYNPYNNERLQPTGGDDQGRLFIGELEVK